MTYQYETNCIGSTARWINDMTDQAKKVSYKTLVRRVGLAQIREQWESIYDFDGEGGLAMKDDWHIGYYKSKYRGRPCYYIDHSSIEYIYTKAG